MIGDDFVIQLALVPDTTKALAKTKAKKTKAKKNILNKVKPVTIIMIKPTDTSSIGFISYSK